MIKDMFTSSKKESLSGCTTGSANVIGAVSSGTVDDVNENKCNEKSITSRWLSSWFSSRASRDDSSQQ